MPRNLKNKNMAKVLIKYIKGLDTYVPGDIRAVDYKEYKHLKNQGIVEKTEILEEIDDESIERASKIEGLLRQI